MKRSPPRSNYSPERALAILHEQGWSDSNGDFYLDKMINGVLTTLELEIITYDEPSAPTRSNAAAAIVEQLNTIGIRATYNPSDPDGSEWTMETMQRALPGRALPTGADRREPEPNAGSASLARHPHGKQFRYIAELFRLCQPRHGFLFERCDVGHR